VNTAPPSERYRQEGCNTISKGCLTTLKEIARVVSATTRKANQTKDQEVSISCLYLIN